MGNIRVPAIFMLVLAMAAMVPATAFKFPWDKHRPEDYWTVYIINLMSHNKELLVHCKSKDDDLGVHTIINGGGYHFTFAPSQWPPWGSTLFWCYLAPDDKSHAAFDAFWDQKDLWDMTDLWSVVWIIQDDGVYIRNPNTHETKFMHPWKPGRELN
ncbi:hypothetical protein Tsubulata_006124 [Turnera subulata]|uniref:S-protein homolog n=1 Tax=Turnera subulata TaxID=218843 RepID=A0A9Q0F8R9_9ROSI|nr:hypothetical protein Tsubulata_006124 [Turnera subulata]